MNRQPSGQLEEEKKYLLSDPFTLGTFFGLVLAIASACSPWQVLAFTDTGSNQLTTLGISGTGNLNIYLFLEQIRFVYVGNFTINQNAQLLGIGELTTSMVGLSGPQVSSITGYGLYNVDGYHVAITMIIFECLLLFVSYYLVAVKEYRNSRKIMDIYRLCTFFAFVLGVVSFAVFYSTNTKYNFSSQTSGTQANQQTWYQKIVFTTSAGPGFQIISAFYSIALSLSSCGVAPGSIDDESRSQKIPASVSSVSDVTNVDEDSDAEDGDAKVQSARMMELSASSVAAREFGSPLVKPEDVAALPPPPAAAPQTDAVATAV
jgi:hypothetical protein